MQAAAAAAGLTSTSAKHTSFSDTAACFSGMLPLAGSTPPDGCDGLPFAGPAPLCLPLKNLSRYEQCHALFESTWHFLWA